jgi:hypothetical protein
MTEEQYALRGQEPVTLPPIRLAFVIDDQVVDVLHTDPRLAAIFLSDPVVLDVTDATEVENSNVFVGAFYNPVEKKFYAAPQLTEE